LELASYCYHRAGNTFTAHACTHTYIHAYIPIPTYIHTHVLLYISFTVTIVDRADCMHIYTCIYIHAYTHIYPYMNTYMYPYTHSHLGDRIVQIVFDFSESFQTPYCQQHRLPSHPATKRKSQRKREGREARAPPPKHDESKQGRRRGRGHQQVIILFLLC
jgi:hypothetical protein